MLYIISIVPVLLYFAIIKGLDGFSLVKWDRVAECLVWGMLSCLMGLLLGNVVSQSFQDKLFPLVEELVKCLPLIIGIVRGREAFLTESVIYGSAIGAGFALLENVLYVYMLTDFSLGDAIIRGFGTALLHVGCSALFASVAVLMQRVAFQKKKGVKLAAATVSVLPSFIIHFAYNLFLLPEYIQLLITLVVIWVLIYLIYCLDEKLINKWLDLCINNDIALYKAIRQGKLRDTNAGQYLNMAKSRFQPEVFFDILMYLGLYLEVSIAAKSRMIMRESGLDIPLTEEEHRKNHDKIVELASLRQSIGKAGVLFLNPFVNAKAVDQWVMNELL